MSGLYMEVGQFLCLMYDRGPSEWFCRRVLDCLRTGQYYTRRDESGKITTFVGWWLIDRDKLAEIINFTHVPGDITSGNMVWVMDAASTDRIGINEFKKALRILYPRTGTVKGVAWLRNELRPVISLRQQGAIWAAAAITR